jgi:hypothetical protein
VTNPKTTISRAAGLLVLIASAISVIVLRCAGRVAQPRTRVKSRLGSTLRVQHLCVFFFAKGAGLDAALPNPPSDSRMVGCFRGLVLALRLKFLRAAVYFTSAGVAVAGPSPTISSTASESFAPS